ncbi:Hypothetical protein UVM_LOCUS295, partial [uncultured virus]
VTGSHLRWDDYFERNKDAAKGRDHFVPIAATESFLRDGVRIAVPRNGMLLWYSSLAHANVAGSNAAAAMTITNRLLRTVLFVSMQRLSACDGRMSDAERAQLLAKRLEVVKAFQTTSHWALFCSPKVYRWPRNAQHLTITAPSLRMSPVDLSDPTVRCLLNGLSPTLGVALSLPAPT